MILLAAALLTICAPGPRDNCVHDGDTWWQGGEKYRAADFDTPELDGKCPFERALAIRARDRFRQLLNAGPYELLRDGRDRDRNGRLLRVVRRYGRSLGDQLISEGLARPWTGRRMPWCP